MRLKQAPQSAHSAEETALNLIAFLLGDDDRTERLVALTGIGRDDLQSRMHEPEFQAFVFDYALQDDALIIEFSQSINQRPESVVAARRKLPGEGF